MGKGTVRFVTSCAIQTLLLPKPMQKHLKFKVRYLIETLRRPFIFYNAEYVAKLLLLVRQKRNLKQNLMIIKARKSPIEKNAKYHSSVFMNIMGNTVIMGLMIGSSH